MLSFLCCNSKLNCQSITACYDNHERRGHYWAEPLTGRYATSIKSLEVKCLAEGLSFLLSSNSLGMLTQHQSTSLPLPLFSDLLTDKTRLDSRIVISLSRTSQCFCRPSFECIYCTSCVNLMHSRTK